MEARIFQAKIHLEAQLFTNKIKLKLLGSRLHVYVCTAIQAMAVCLYLITDKVAILELNKSSKIAVFVLSTFIINMVIMAAVSYGIAALTKPKQKRPTAPTPAGLEQFEVPTAEEGRPIQVLFGKKYISGPNVLWYGDLTTRKITKRY